LGAARKRHEEWLASLDTWGETPHSYQELAVSFMRDYCPQLKPSAAKRYQVSMRQLDPFFGDKMLDQITSAALADYVKARRVGASQATIRRDLMCLASMFTHAQVDLEWVDSNPVALYLRRQKRRGRLKESPPRTRYLTEAEEERLLSACRPDLAQQVAFAIDTGLRQEEQFSLPVWLVDITQNRVTVDKTAAKSGRARTIPVLPRSAQISAQSIAGKQPADWLFQKPNGDRWPDRRKPFKTALKKAGLEDVTWHDLRRTCGCRLLQQHGLTMKQVQDWLGHESLRTTETTYAFLEAEHLMPRTKTGTGTADSAEE